jgi:peptidoglycan hydrolase-like protein with peptidoglycan-binding domain
MSERTALSVLLLVPAFALAADALTSLHPEAAYPDTAAPLLNSSGPYADLNKRVQEKLHEQGFDAGPINGDFGAKTQAALAQFQLSRAIPASGMLDEQTLAELGVELNKQQPAQSGSASSGN